MIDLTNYDKIIISISGGKDSQAMTEIISAEAGVVGVSNRLILTYADTGAEWPESLEQCEIIAEKYNIPLLINNSHRALPEHIARRGMWPSATCRYCTSDCKRDAVHKAVRKYQGNVLVVTGERREESRHRSMLEESGTLGRLTTKTRNVSFYRPMLGFTEEDIWRTIRASGLAAHPAYSYGNERVSCVLCVLASENDLRVGANHYPGLADNYLRMEHAINHTFRNNKSLKEILK